jgi:hypothetical protein
MDCWHCRRTAVGTCRFCGRAICENHVEELPFILDVFRSQEKTKVLVVEDALYCGACSPRPEPLDMPELD